MPDIKKIKKGPSHEDHGKMKRRTGTSDKFRSHKESANQGQDYNPAAKQALQDNYED